MPFDIIEWIVRRQEEQQGRIEELTAEIAEIHHLAAEHGFQIKSHNTRITSVEDMMKTWRAYASKAYFILIPLLLIAANVDPETVVKTVLKIASAAL